MIFPSDHLVVYILVYCQHEAPFLFDARWCEVASLTDQVGPRKVLLDFVQLDREPQSRYDQITRFDVDRPFPLIGIFHFEGRAVWDLKLGTPVSISWVGVVGRFAHLRVATGRGMAFLRHCNVVRSQI